MLPGGARFRRTNKRPSPSPHPGAGSNPDRDYARSLGNNASGPEDPFSAVAVHGDRRAGGRAAVAIVGGSRRKSHGGKVTRLLLMFQPCLLKLSDTQSSDSNQGLVPAASMQPRTSSRRMRGYSCGTQSRAACPDLKARETALSTDPFCYGVYGAVNWRRVPRPLQKSTNMLLEYSVPLSVWNARGTPISATKRFMTEKWPRALFTPAVRPMDMRSAAHEHHDVQRPPEKSRIGSSGVNVDKS